MPEGVGRGAVTVDTTLQPDPEKGNPMWYTTQEQIIEYNWTDEMRMVAQYDPRWEFVATLLKAQDRVSSYRVGVPGEKPSGED